MIMMKRIGLALGGGGARGLCHIAFIRALEETGYRPVIISGTSIGSLVGAFYAAGVGAEGMLNILEELDLGDINRMIDLSLRNKAGVIRGKGIEEFLRRYLPVRTFGELSIPLRVVATDLWNRREVVFDSGDLVAAIRASISIPIIFEPLELDGRILIDGGVLNPVPHDVIRRSCDILIAIDVSGGKDPPVDKLMPGMFDSVLATFQIMQTAISQNRAQSSKVDIYIKPALSGYRMLDFVKHKKIIESVKADVENFKVTLRKKMRGWFFA